MKTKLVLTIATLLLSILSSTVMASGSYGGGRSYDRSEPKQIDQTYETGKALFKGRGSSAGKLNYCISVGDELLPVKRSSLQNYKNSSYNDVANQLFNCDQPDTKIAEQLTKDELLYVMYYLNKRFKLKLG